MYFFVKYLMMLPAADTNARINNTLFLPTRSDHVPINVLAKATPISVHIGRKYVAELKPNGSALPNESSDAPGVFMMAKFRLSIFVLTADVTIMKLTALMEILRAFSSVSFLDIGW